MPTLIEFLLFAVGTAIVSWGAYLWGKVTGWAAGATWRAKAKKGLRQVETFDQKVDIVCNACGLVGEFECASCCNPYEECGYFGGDWRCYCLGAPKSNCLVWTKEYYERMSKK